jgi:hypothetical protein
MNSLHRVKTALLTVCISMALITAFSTTPAKAARLGHPAYSASGATAAQKQWNLVCDPVGAETGSTSTMYPAGDAAINTINAFPGFQINQVNILINDGEGTFVQSFFLDPNTTSFVITQGEAALSAAIATGPTTTYYAFLDGPEAGAVQVFWAPLGSSTGEEVGAATVLNKAHLCNGPSFGGGRNADVNTHTIIFDSISNATTATFTNFANGHTPDLTIFDEFDGYSGPGFSYTADQIDSATVTLKLPSPCNNGKGNKGRGKPVFHNGHDDDGGYGKEH